METNGNVQETVKPDVDGNVQEGEKPTEIGRAHV